MTNGRNQRRRLRLSTVFIGVVAALALGACANDDEATGSDDASSPALDEQAGVEEFCAEFDGLAGERPESYVGSDEHISDVERLLAVSPPDIRSEVGRYRDFLASGAVSSDDPDSNLFDNWPAEVQADITAVQDYRDGNC
ncbi:MAG: hypothetical protein ACLFRV_07355 [Acidimicrobiales bacterium]